jgi:hypothetical protein
MWPAMLEGPLRSQLTVAHAQSSAGQQVGFMLPHALKRWF